MAWGGGRERFGIRVWGGWGRLGGAGGVGGAGAPTSQGLPKGATQAGSGAARGPESVPIARIGAKSMGAAMDAVRNAFVESSENRQASLDEIGGTKTLESFNQGLISLSGGKGSWSAQNWNDGLGDGNTRPSRMISKSPGPEEAQKFRAQLTKGISQKGRKGPTQIIILLFVKLYLGSFKVS